MDQMLILSLRKYIRIGSENMLEQTKSQDQKQQICELRSSNTSEMKQPL